MKNPILFLFLLPLLACSKGEGGETHSSDNTGGTQPATLSAPSGVQLKEATSSTLAFTWNAVSGAKSYNCRLKQGAQQVALESVSGTEVLIGSLSAATAYSFQVQTVSEGAKSDYSNPLSVSTLENPAPEPSGEVVCVDAPLEISFSAAPVLGTSGMVKVFTASGTLVDQIDLSDIATVNIREDGTMVPKEPMKAETVYNTFMDALQGASGCYRIVHYTPFRVSGKKLIVKLHSGKLSFGQNYYATLDASVAGRAVEKFEFSTKAKPSGTTLKVSTDGSGDFCTIQGALTYAGTLGKDTEVKLEVGEGTYQEILYLRNKNNLIIEGLSPSGTRLVYANTEKLCTTTGSRVDAVPSVGSAIRTPGGRSLFLVEGCDNLTLRNLAIHNDIGENDGQAECLYFNGDGKKLLIEGCRLISWQDTFETKGSVYVHDTYIAGHVDFIWGNPSACLFENCEIVSRSSGRYIVQARCASTAKGFVFLNCNIHGESGVSGTYLARSGGNSSDFDNVTYIGCTMSGIAAAGWYTNPTPNPSVATASAGWKEYGSKDASGAALPVSGRSSSACILSADEAAAFNSRSVVLGW